MEDKATIIESLLEKAEAYSQTSIELLKLKAIDKSANTLSSFLTILIISVAVICIIAMVNIGAALWIGLLIGSSFGGFFIVAAFYTIVVLILYVFRKSILKIPLSNSIINHIRMEKNI